MQAVKDPPMETIHFYYEREEPKKPFVLLPLLFALVCLFGIVAVTIYSWQHPTYERETLTIPASFLPLQTFSVTEPIIPTGRRYRPAIAAHGILTIYNGSVITQTLPAGMIITSTNGVEFVVQDAVTVAAGNPPNYGIATVEAYALLQGTQGNIQPNAIHQVIGSSLYVRNLTSFHGGKDSYTETVQLPQDRQTALDHARAVLRSMAQIKAILAYPCKEMSRETGRERAVRWAVEWTCQFVAYPIVPGKRIIAVRLVGKNLLVDVLFVPKPRTIVPR